MLDIPSLLRVLAEKRPVFHSEADFQHALAWELHGKWPQYGLRLEYRLPEVEPPVHLDIWWKHERPCAIELKYKTRRLDTSVDGERFVLRNHAAQTRPFSRACSWDVRISRVCRMDF